MEQNTKKPNVLAMSMSRLTCTSSIMAWMCLLLSMSAQANTWVWTGGGGVNANWNNSANWGSAGIPGNGDTVVFQGATGLNTTNNIASLTLGQIKFISSGFGVYGLPFTLTNSIVATNFTGSAAINNGFTIATADVTMLVSNGITLTLNTNFTGTVGVVKSGQGVLLYQGPGDNTYMGTTTVSGGTLEFNVFGYQAFEGPLVIGDGSGLNNPTVEDLQPDEFSQTNPITISLNGTLNLNNQNDVVGTNLTLLGGTIETGSGILYLPANCALSATGGNSFIFGNLNANGALTIQANGILFVSASLSGTANIVQSGTGVVEWLGANTYAGNYTANGGNVYLRNSLALGNVANQMTVNSNSSIYLLVSVNLTNQSLTLNNTGGGGLIYSANGSTNVWQSNFTNNTGMTLQQDSSCALNLMGPISGAGGLTETGQGTLTLSGSTSNTYAGATAVNGGTLLLGKPFEVTAVPSPLSIGGSNTVRLLNAYQINNPATPVTMAVGSVLNLAGFNESVGPITMQGAQITTGLGGLYLNGDITVNPSAVMQSLISGLLVIWTSTHTITNSAHALSPDLLISASISSGANLGLIKSGDGEVALSGNNSFTGPVTINGGDIWAENSNALGSNTNVPVTVNSGGSLYLKGSGLNFGLKPLGLSGSGYGIGTVACFGSSVWAGNVTLNTDSTVDVYTNSALTFSGPINGPGGLTELGTGTNTLSGAQANTYIGQTFVNVGVLNLSKSSGQAVGTNTLTIGDSLGGYASALVESFFDNQLNGINLVINDDGLLNLNSHNDQAGPNVTLNDSGIQNGAAAMLTLLNGTQLTANGSGYLYCKLNVGNTSCVWSNTGGLYVFGNVLGAASITLSGGGAFYLSASNYFTGPMVLQQGLLFAQNPWALGTTNGGTVVSNGASLILDQSIGITNEALTIYGPGSGGIGGYASLDVEGAPISGTVPLPTTGAAPWMRTAGVPNCISAARSAARAVWNCLTKGLAAARFSSKATRPIPTRG
jgi:fibronectin-binding autotransporter adhesin